jgi:ribosomal protein S2
MLLTFASSYADEYGVERPFSIRGAKGVATAAGIAVACELVSKQSVRVRRFVGGTLTNGQQIVVVW